MDIKKLEDGSIVISSPNLSPRLSPGKFQDKTLCGCILKIHSCVAHKAIYRYLILFSVIFGCSIVVVTFKDYARSILFWIEKQDSWLIFLVVVSLFVVVSFPVVVGYLLLIIASGYLLGCFYGLITVVTGVNLGVFIAHNTIKSINRRYPVHRLIKNETGRAILRVISGSRQFKIVLFCRLTPIPFGLQNTIFGISSVKSHYYHVASLIGLLPAQVINVYLGSKLRSIHDVFNDHHTALAGYGVFVMEVLIGIALMLWIVHKARNELSAALLTDCEVDEKLLVEVQT